MNQIILRVLIPVVASLTLLSPTNIGAQPVSSPVMWKDVTPGAWRWLEDYAFFTATYVIGCPPQRKCRIGTGMFVSGEPQGAEREFTGDVEMSVWGLGALHIKVYDGTEPARIGFYRRETMVIPIYPLPGK